MHHGAKAAGRLRSVGGPPPSPPREKIAPPWSLAAHPIPTTTARSSLLPATLIGGYLQRSSKDLSLVHYVDFESGRGKGWRVERGLPNYEGACESLPTPNSGVEGDRAAKRQVKSAFRT
jgi:hypothetical protein